MLLFSAPFSFEMTDVVENMQLELMELQYDDNLRSYFSVLFIQVRATFYCRVLASRMKLTKSKTRAPLTDNHLEDVLLLSCSSLAPDIDSMSNSIQH